MDLLKLVKCSEKLYIEENGIKDALLKETGKDRVRRMFTKNDLGLMSPELTYVVRNGTAMTAVSAFIGAVIHMNSAKTDYIRKNMASAYESEHFAKRSLMDCMTLAGMRGAFKFAVKYGAFGSTYLLSTMVIENYTNKFTIWEHAGTLAVLGGVSRINYGLKGALAGSCLGAVLGCMTGGIMVFNMWLSGISFEDFRYWHHEYYYTHTLKKKVD